MITATTPGDFGASISDRDIPSVWVSISTTRTVRARAHQTQLGMNIKASCCGSLIFGTVPFRIVWCMFVVNECHFGRLHNVDVLATQTNPTVPTRPPHAHIPRGSRRKRRVAAATFGGKLHPHNGNGPCHPPDLDLMATERPLYPASWQRRCLATQHLPTAVHEA